ncbi:hypothetical protein [Methylophaga nitratireducenticrescens]|uniref:Uncharacterized protein n=1 Tax=Methylophaga nitratireducenticrescens TaxID=754476 RepID=I1XGB5_METNJ|nr:hypothetical protein [Methylophaga nitratireducenticrescens]AFI83434.1 hypothetical protein Q7A_588 [Methylophaga nitratireducenticrescens]AUZ83538.1 hypothetical protein CDW43_02680 [Methylophaga nitratireducenticrescens]
MMKKFITIIYITALAVFSVSSFADEGPGNAQDKGKKQHEQHDQKHHNDDEKHRNYEHDSKHMDKHHDKKMDKERKELGKGSEQGQESREEHSQKWSNFEDDDKSDEARRPWWKFWGND